MRHYECRSALPKMKNDPFHIFLGRALGDMRTGYAPFHNSRGSGIYGHSF